MLIKKMSKCITGIYILLILSTLQSSASASSSEFDAWVKSFKVEAIKSGVSKTVVNDVMSNVKYLPKVIEYDRFQPEFYEDTHTYIKVSIDGKNTCCSKR